MNEQQRRKVELAKQKLAQREAPVEKPDMMVMGTAELTKLYDSLDTLLTATSEKLDETGEKIASTNKMHLINLNNALVKLMKVVEMGARAMASDTEKIVKVSNLNTLVSSMPKVTKYDDTKQIAELLENRKAIKGLSKDITRGLALIADQLGDSLEGLKPEQTPDAFIPFRRVYKQGNRLAFDDTTWAGSQSGGGSSPSGLVTEAYNAIYASFPDTETEVYSYKLGSTLVATVTVTYTDSSKVDLVSVVRS